MRGRARARERQRDDDDGDDGRGRGGLAGPGRQPRVPHLPRRVHGRLLHFMRPHLLLRVHHQPPQAHAHVPVLLPGARKATSATAGSRTRVVRLSGVSPLDVPRKNLRKQNVNTSLSRLRVTQRPRRFCSVAAVAVAFRGTPPRLTAVPSPN